MKVLRVNWTCITANPISTVKGLLVTWHRKGGSQSLFKNETWKESNLAGVNTVVSQSSNRYFFLVGGRVELGEWEEEAELRH